MCSPQKETLVLSCCRSHGAGGPKTLHQGRGRGPFPRSPDFQYNWTWVPRFCIIKKVICSQRLHGWLLRVQFNLGLELNPGFCHGWEREAVGGAVASRSFHLLDNSYICLLSSFSLWPVHPVSVIASQPPFWNWDVLRSASLIAFLFTDWSVSAVPNGAQERNLTRPLKLLKDKSHLLYIKVKHVQ